MCKNYIICIVKNKKNKKIILDRIDKSIIEIEYFQVSI